MALAFSQVLMGVRPPIDGCEPVRWRDAVGVFNRWRRNGLGDFSILGRRSVCGLTSVLRYQTDDVMRVYPAGLGLDELVALFGSGGSITTSGTRPLTS
jgi:hypothetical protein